MAPDSEQEPIEVSYLGVFQNIEAAIVRIYRQQPELGDLQVDAAIEALIRTYEGEARAHPPTLPRSAQAQTVYQAVHAIGEWRLGRQGLMNDDGQLIQMDKPLSIGEWVACLKRIRKSIRTWNKSHGSQGYLQFITRFIR